MRIWSLHPRHLDRQALIACWRETLLAQKVLLGETKGYIRHPQLIRFQELDDPVAGIGTYLQALVAEATARSYTFDATKIVRTEPSLRMTVTRGQLDLETEHLAGKLRQRSPELAAHFPPAEGVRPHPLFDVIDGPVADWERATA